MPVFDALTTSFGTAGTGGFGIKNDSIAGYSTYIQVVVTVFMILFGVNFSAYFLIISGKLKQALHIEEIRWYLAIIAIAIITITINVYHIYGSIAESLQQVSFQVASITLQQGILPPRTLTHGRKCPERILSPHVCRVPVQAVPAAASRCHVLSS